MANWLLIAAVVVLGFALRSCDRAILFRMSILCFAGAAFLLGWLIFGSLAWGAFLVFIFFALPFLGIILETLSWRIVRHRKIESCAPPSPQDFPNLNELTNEIEEAGFEYCADIGNEVEEGDGEDDVFFRVFLNAAATTQATICLVNHAGLSFFYVALASYLGDKKAFLTSNYPFPEELKFLPHTVTQRMVGGESLAVQLAAHQELLETHEAKNLLPLEAASIPARLEEEFSLRIDYNISIGLLRPAPEERVSYTPKGIFFLCRQFIRDFFFLRS